MRPSLLLPLVRDRLVLVPSLLALLFVFASSLCSCDDASSDCSINSDCKAGETCVKGQCVVQCREQRDCPSGHVCSVGRCEPHFGGNCSKDEDCLNGQLCLSGVCQLSDATSNDTPSNDTTTADTVQDSTHDTSLDPAPDTSPDLVGDTHVDSTTPPTDTFVQDTPPADTQDTFVQDTLLADETDGGCTPRAGVYGEVCECSQQCSSGLCIGNPISGVGMCTVTCVNRTNCRNGLDACINAGTKVCAPDDTGSPCSTNGINNPTLCVYQTCLSAAGANAVPQDFCSIACNTAADCKANHSCSPMVCNNVNDSGFLQCIPTAMPWEPCPGQTTCPARDTMLATYSLAGSFCVPTGGPNPCVTDTDANACFTALCDASNAVCLDQCLDPSQCASGTCYQYDVSDPRLPIGYCAP